MDTLFVWAPAPICMCSNLEAISQEDNGRADGLRHTLEVHQWAEWPYWPWCNPQGCRGFVHMCWWERCCFYSTWNSTIIATWEWEWYAIFSTWWWSIVMQCHLMTWYVLFIFFLLGCSTLYYCWSYNANVCNHISLIGSCYHVLPLNWICISFNFRCL